MDLYSYTGPVTMFDRCVANYWKGETYASSEKKAKSNLVYQYKKQNGLILVHYRCPLPLNLLAS